MLGAFIDPWLKAESLLINTSEDELVEFGAALHSYSAAVRDALKQTEQEIELRSPDARLINPSMRPEEVLVYGEGTPPLYLLSSAIHRLSTNLPSVAERMVEAD